MGGMNGGEKISSNKTVRLLSLINAPIVASEKEGQGSFLKMPDGCT